MKPFHQFCQLYFILTAFTHYGVHSWVEFFDAHYDDCDNCYLYKYDQHLDTSPGHCVNLPQYVGDQTQEVWASECTVLFQHLNCQSYYMIIDPPSWITDFFFFSRMSPILSFASCSSFKHLIRYDLYQNPNYNGPLRTYTDVQICNCLNLPLGVAKEVSSLATNGGCLRLHSDKDCQGRMIELTKDSLHHDNLNQLRFDKDASSISLCESLLPECLKLSGVATAFRSMTNLEDLIQEKDLNKLELSSTSIFINNGSSPISKTYEGRRSYKESYTFERVESLVVINTFSIGASMSVEAGGGIDLGIFSVGAKMKTELSAAYQFQSQQGSQTKNKYITEESKEFTVRETFTVPPCSIYHVNSFMLVGENLPVEYDLEIMLAGEDRHGKVSWDSYELRKYLPPGLEYIRNLNDSSGAILVKARGTIVTNLGVKSKVAVNEEAVPSCRGWFDNYKWYLLLAGASILLLCMVVFIMAHLLIVRKRLHDQAGTGQGHLFSNIDEMRPLLPGTGVININSNTD